MGQIPAPRPIAAELQTLPEDAFESPALSVRCAARHERCRLSLPDSCAMPFTRNN